MLTEADVHARRIRGDVVVCETETKWEESMMDTI
jgi:hypothetical protein